MAILCVAPAHARFSVEPALTLRAEYDTNIISLGYEGIDGGLFIISPSIGIHGDLARTNLALDLGVDIWRYKDLDPNDGVDLTDYNAEVPFVKAGAGKLLFGSVGVDLEGGYRKDLTMTHRYEVSNDYFRSPVESYYGSAKLSWNPSTRTKIAGGVTYGRLDYQDNRDVADSVGIGYNLNAAYDLTERITFGGGVGHETREYDPEDTATSTSLSGQLSYRMSRTYSLETRATLDYVDPGAGLDRETLWTAAVIGRRERPKTLIQADVHRSRTEVREQGGVPQADGASLAFTFKASPKLNLVAAGIFDRIDYSAIPLEEASRRDDFVKASVRVTYEAHKDIFVRCDYVYIHRNSNDDFFDYGNHQVGVSLVGSLSLF